MGIGDWGLWIGPNPQFLIPNPQSPIPNPQKKHFKKYIIKYIKYKIKYPFNVHPSPALYLSDISSADILV